LKTRRKRRRPEAPTHMERLEALLEAPQRRDKVMKAFLLHGDIDGQEDYARRGRAFADLDDATLSETWIDALRACVLAPEDWRTRERQTDLRAEIALRGREPEWSRVRGELRAYVAAGRRLMTEMNDNEPDRYREIANGIGEAVRAFERRIAGGLD